jgi:twinkle protein
MKIISLKTKIVYDLDVSKSGENNIKCPECSQNRKKKSSKPFRWNNTKLVGHCYHCDTSFVEYKPYKVEKTFVLPEWKNETKLTDKVVKYFTGRMISQNTLNKAKVYCENHFMPQFEKEMEAICFPYFFNDKLINVKYRGAEKSFVMVTGAELIFLNLDCVTQFEKIIIVEGEIDYLSLVEIGFENCLSVPNGASGKELTYIDNYIELFVGKKIIIAVDNDLPGTDLKNELIRRFGSENCLTVNFEDCKDANEVLCEKGGNVLRDIIENAKEIPVSGIIDIDDNYENIYNLFLHGLEKGKLLGIEELDKIVSWELSRLAVWTGIPSHGKSTVVDLVNVTLNMLYGWKVTYFSPESHPIQYHYARIASIISGRKFKVGNIDEKEFEELFDYIKNNFFFIYPEENFKVETVLAKAQHLVKKKGTRILTIDPYNWLEKTKTKGESDTDYAGRILTDFINFSKRNSNLVHIVAHPTKMKKQMNGQFEVPTMYDVNGSANFYNMPDYGICIYRHFGKDPKIDINVLKVKWNHLGDGGTAEFMYNYNNYRLEKMGSTVDQWNNKSYLYKDIVLKPINTIDANDDFWDNKETDESNPF